MVAATKPFAKWRQLFVKNGLKKLGFLSKTSIFHTFWNIRLVQILPVCSPNTYETIYRETLEFQCQHLQRSHGKVLSKFTAKNGF